VQKPISPSQDRDQVVTYIFEMSSALSELARGHNLRFLAYLLEMVALACANGTVDSDRVRVGGKLK